MTIFSLKRKAHKFVNMAFYFIFFIIGFIIGLSCSLAILFVAYKIADFSDLMSLILYKRNKEKEETSKPPVVTQTATNSNINNSGKDIPIVKTITVSTKTIHPDK